MWQTYLPRQIVIKGHLKHGKKGKLMNQINQWNQKHKKRINRLSNKKTVFLTLVSKSITTKTERSESKAQILCHKSSTTRNAAHGQAD